MHKQNAALPVESIEWNKHWYREKNTPSSTIEDWLMKRETKRYCDQVRSMCYYVLMKFYFFILFHSLNLFIWTCCCVGEWNNMNRKRLKRNYSKMKNTSTISLSSLLFPNTKEKERVCSTEFGDVEVVFDACF